MQKTFPVSPPNGFLCNSSKHSNALANSCTARKPNEVAVAIDIDPTTSIAIPMAAAEFDTSLANHRSQKLSTASCSSRNLNDDSPHSSASDAQCSCDHSRASSPAFCTERQLQNGASSVEAHKRSRGCRDRLVGRDLADPDEVMGMSSGSWFEGVGQWAEDSTSIRQSVHRCASKNAVGGDPSCYYSQDADLYEENDQTKADSSPLVVRHKDRDRLVPTSSKERHTDQSNGPLGVSYVPAKLPIRATASLSYANAMLCDDYGAKSDRATSAEQQRLGEENDSAQDATSSASVHDFLKQLRVRYLCSTDIDEVKNLCNQIFPVEYPHYWFADITSNNGLFSLAATHNDKIIGLLVAEVKRISQCNPEDKDILATQFPGNTCVAYVLSLGVLKQYRRHGVGSFLFDHLLQYLTNGFGTSLGVVKAVYLHVLAANRDAIAFYERLKFRQHCHLLGYYSINGELRDGYSYVLYINGGTPPWTYADCAEAICLKMFRPLCALPRLLLRLFHRLCSF